MGVSMRHLHLVASVSLTLLVAVPVHAAQVTIDRTQRSQTIDGFGFFGAGARRNSLSTVSQVRAGRL
jgi:O-glycosyl hydrolase